MKKAKNQKHWWRVTRTFIQITVVALLFLTASAKAGPFDIVELPICAPDERPGYLFGISGDAYYVKCHQKIRRVDAGTGDTVFDTRPFPSMQGNISIRYNVLSDDGDDILLLNYPNTFLVLNSSSLSGVLGPHSYPYSHVFGIAESPSAINKIIHGARRFGGSPMHGIFFKDSSSLLAPICDTGWPAAFPNFEIRNAADPVFIPDSFYQTTNPEENYYGGVNTVWVPWEPPGAAFSYVNIINVDSCSPARSNDAAGDLQYPHEADLLTIVNVPETETVWISVDANGFDPPAPASIDVYNRKTLALVKRFSPVELDLDRRFAFTYSPEEGFVFGVSKNRKVFKANIADYSVSILGEIPECANNGDARWFHPNGEASSYVYNGVPPRRQKILYDPENSYLLIGCDDKVIRFKINPLPPSINFTRSPIMTGGGVISARFAEFEGTINGEADDAVQSLEYKLDNSINWIMVNKCEGEFTHTSAKFSITLSGLAVGQHTVQFRATGVTGGTSEPITQTFEVIEESPVPTHKIGLYYDYQSLTPFHNAFYNSPNPPSPTLGLHVFAAGNPPVEVNHVEAQRNAGAVTAWVDDLSKEYFVVYKNPFCLVRN